MILSGETPKMTIRPYPATGYTRLPWKNGSGQTDEICLLPDGASRARFDIRVSSAPITAPGGFSAFPGVDRVITLIEGKELSLSFAEETVTLNPFVPFGFDSGLAPVGDPRDGPVRVLNMMADRARWKIAETRLLKGPACLDPSLGGSLFLVALAPASLAAGKERCDLAAFDSALVEGAAQIALPDADTARPGAIAYFLTPAEPQPA
ncbi:HutD family protein [Sulfitobacter aestuarii]|uniref:HutD family protein n=1 Tax=Sulfitobacter aestuarii TaxID=2161676 RepID=A0ABW5U670_9RHOB